VVACANDGDDTGMPDKRFLPQHEGIEVSFSAAALLSYSRPVNRCASTKHPAFAGPDCGYRILGHLCPLYPHSAAVRSGRRTCFALVRVAPDIGARIKLCDLARFTSGKPGDRLSVSWSAVAP